MRFEGAAPNNTAHIVARWVKHHGFKSVQIICSGSFKLETAIRKLCPDVKIYANDVSIYSCMLGDMYMGDDTGGIQFKDSVGVLNEAKSRGVAACVLYSSLQTYRRRFTWDEKDLRNIVEVADSRYDDMAEKRDNLQLDAFYKRDLMDLAFDNDAEAVIGFPPYHKGGYERVWSILEEHVEWTKPKYTMFEASKGTRALCERLVEQGKPWLVMTNQRLDDIPMVGFESRGSLTKPVYTFGEPAFPIISPIPYLKRTPVFIDHVDPWELTEKSVIDVMPLNSETISSILASYNRYWNPGITTGMRPLIYTLDGKAVGITAWNASGAFMKDLAFLHLDFTFVNERRISKLIPMLALCDEVRTWIQYMYMRKFNGVITRVVTKNPVSIKYRGTGFKVRSRHPEHLWYKADWSQRRLQETYRLWFNKHARKCKYPSKS